MIHQRKIVLDTNSLMAIQLLNIDIFEEIDKALDFPYRLHVLQATIDELNTIIKTQREKYRRAARLALKLLQVKPVKLIERQGYVDDMLVEYSHKGVLVLTQDLGLKRRLKKPYLTIRQGKKITRKDR